MLVTAVHPVLRKIDSYLEVCRLRVNDTQFDVTIAYDVTLLVNQVNTYQWLTVNSFLSSNLTSDGLTVSSYRTCSEYTFGNLLNVNRLTCLVLTNLIVDSGELIVQAKSFQQLVRHYLVGNTCTILSKAQIVVVGLNEWLQIDTVRIVVKQRVSSRH